MRPNPTPRTYLELADLVVALVTNPALCAAVVVPLCGSLARRDAIDLRLAGGAPADLDTTLEGIAMEAAATCAELLAAGPAAITDWLAARLGPVGAWVELHRRFAGAPTDTSVPDPL